MENRSGNAATGELRELYISNGTMMGKVHVDGSEINVPMFFILDASVGDTVMIESGIATSVYHQEDENEYMFSES